MSEKPKRPRDINERAKLIVAVVTGDKELPEKQPSNKNPHAVALGKLGGIKGGKARSENLSDERKKEIARNAAKARWK